MGRLELVTRSEKAARLAKILSRVPAEGRARLRYHALIGTGVCVGAEAVYWFRDGRACPTILASTRDVPEGEATGDLWRAKTERAPWPELVGLLREMTEDEVREAMLGAGS